MTKSTRNVVLALVGVVLLGCLGTAALVVGFGVFAASQFGADTGWTEDAVPERELPRLFGVRLPVRPLHYRSRQQGFQDGFWEVVVQLPPGSAEALLGLNKLTRGATSASGEASAAVSLGADVLEVIRAVDPTAASSPVTTLELPAALGADGGALNLHRRAALLEGPGTVWLYLEAFEG